VRGHGDGVDLRKGGTEVGMSIIPYPHRTKKVSNESSRSLAAWVSHRSFLVSSPVTRIQFGLGAAWEVDVRPRSTSPQRKNCPVGSRCVPLLWSGFSVESSGRPLAVGLLPNTTARLIFFGERGLASVLWIWTTSAEGSGPSAEVQHVVDSLRFEPL
jgi:hypothetical protein